MAIGPVVSQLVPAFLVMACPAELIAARADGTGGSEPS